MDKVGTLRWDWRRPPRPAWTTCSRPTTPTAAASMACCRPMTACRSGIISSLQGVGYGTADQPMADRHRPGRRDCLGQVDHRRRAVLDRVQGHPRTRQGHRRAWSTRCCRAARAGGQRHQDLQQRRQGRSVLPADARMPSTSRNYQEMLVDSGYYKADRSEVIVSYMPARAPLTARALRSGDS